MTVVPVTKLVSGALLDLAPGRKDRLFLPKSWETDVGQTIEQSIKSPICGYHSEKNQSETELSLASYALPNRPH